MIALLDALAFVPMLPIRLGNIWLRGARWGYWRFPPYVGGSWRT